MLDRRVFLVLAAALADRAAAATEPVSKQACIAAHEQAQETRQSNKLRDAREHLKLCSNVACPPLVKTDCVPWLAELEKLQPSALILVRGDGGAALSGATILLDDAPVSENSPVDLDPGEHRVQVDLSGYARQSLRFSIEPGQKARKIEVSLARSSQSSPSPSARPRRSLAPPLILGGVGLAGLGAFAYFGLSGKADEDELKKCKPLCAQTRVDDTSRKYIFADIGLGVGIVALGVATYLLASRPAEPKTSVAPWVNPQGAGLGVAGRF